MTGSLLLLFFWVGPPTAEAPHDPAAAEGPSTVQSPPSDGTSAGRTPPPQPGFSLSFALEPRLGTYGARNPRLEDYGYASVSPFLLTYGLRGRVYGQRGWVIGGAMSYGVSVNEAEGNPVPSVLSRIESALSIGHQLGAGFEASVDVAFAVQTLTVGSNAGGGSLLDLGPALVPRVSWAPRKIKGSYLRLNLGYALSFAVAPPHSNPLWEEPFRQVVQHSFVFGVEMGYHQGRPIWGWGR